MGYCRLGIQHSLGFSKIWEMAGFGIQKVLRLQTPQNSASPCGRQGPIPGSAPGSKGGQELYPCSSKGAQADPAYFSRLLINCSSFDRINIPSKHLSSPTPLPSPFLGKMIYSRKCSCLEKRLRGKGRGLYQWDMQSTFILAFISPIPC